MSAKTTKSLGEQTMNATPSAVPEGYKPNYDWKTVDPVTGNVVEYDLDSIIDYDGPSILRPGYAIHRGWSEKDGHTTWIAHDDNEPFTLAELLDLREQLDAILEEHQG